MIFSSPIRIYIFADFEKMLYDNAALSQVYTEAYQMTHKEMYKSVAMETLDYILNVMEHNAGGYYSAGKSLLV